jgi:hypothetical protein
MGKGKRRRLKRENYEVIFALPVLLPLPDDYSVTQYAGEDGPVVSTIRFRWGEAMDSRPFGAITAVTRETWGTQITEIGPHQAFRDRITVVIGSTVARPVWDDVPHEELSDPYFARILRQVDNLLQAYGLLASQPVPNLGPTTIFHVMVQRWVMSDGSTTDPELVVLDTEKTAWERVERLLPMSQAKRNELAQIAARLDRVRAGRPYYTSVRLFASANRSLIARDPEAAVVETASAVESMGWETLRSLAEEDGKPAPSSRTAFRNALLDHLLPRLGVPAADPAVVRWLADGYELRHKVVHDGAEPTMAAALEATRAGDALSARLDDALVDAVALYPRTAARKLGSALLERVPGDAAVAAVVAEETVSPLKVGVVQEE